MMRENDERALREKSDGNEGNIGQYVFAYRRIAIVFTVIVLALLR